MVCRVTVDQSVPGAQPPECADAATGADFTIPIRVRPAALGCDPDRGDREPVGAGAEPADRVDAQEPADRGAGWEPAERGVPVFVDPTGRRRRRIRIACYAGATICVGYLVLVAVSMAGGAAGPRALLPLAILGDKAAPAHPGGADGAARPHGLQGATRGPAGGRANRVASTTTPTSPAPTHVLPAPAAPAAVLAAPAIASAGAPSATSPAPTRSAVPESTATTVPPTPQPTAQPTPQSTSLPGPRTTGQATTSPVRPQALPAPTSSPSVSSPTAATTPAPAAGPRP
jgi:hypothetical protein